MSDTTQCLSYVEALKAIAQYGSDTLSGRVDGPDDREWQREAVREMTKRAIAALATPPAATREAEHDDGDDVIDRWVDSKSEWISNWAAPRSDIAALIGEALEHWGRSAIREVGIAPHRELVEEWLSEIWHEGTPVLTSASDMHLAARAADWARAQQATREAGPLPHAAPTDEQLLELMPQQFRNDLATVSRLAAHGALVGPGIFRVSLNTGALAYARTVLTRWGGAAVQPVPVSERLPAGKDLDGNGRCWVYQNKRSTTHWLPHWALPVPAAGEGEGQP